MKRNQGFTQPNVNSDFSNMINTVADSLTQFEEAKRPNKASRLVAPDSFPGNSSRALIGSGVVIPISMNSRGAKPSAQTHGGFMITSLPLTINRDNTTSFSDAILGEPDETFFVNLLNAPVSKNQGIGTILNND
jgi:hypothetical protein